MKRLVVNLVALLVIGMGGLYLTASANAVSNNNVQSASSCLDMGCVGGNLDCYSPPGGGMCYTGGDETVEK